MVSCKDKLKSFINGKAGLATWIDNFDSWGMISIVSVVFLIVLFLDVLAGYCLCCHPDREDNKQFASPYAPLH